LDLGVYPISLVHHLLGRPKTIAASGLLTPAGVDSSVGITMTFRKAIATIATTMSARTHNVATITGTKGRILISDTFYAPGATITVDLDGEAPYTLATPVEGGLQFEAAE